MIKLVQPQIEELKYRKKLLKDPQTMSFNKNNEVCLFRGLKTHDATVFHKLAERHFYRVFYSR